MIPIWQHGIQYRQQDQIISNTFCPALQEISPLIAWIIAMLGKGMRCLWKWMNVFRTSKMMLRTYGKLENNWFGIRDLFVTDPSNKYYAVSLSGYQGSPEAEALREWNEFLENYDTDHRILDELGNCAYVAEGRDELIYRVGGNFMDTVKGGAYIYENGSFHFEGDVELDGGKTIGFQLTRKVKGTFDELYLNIGQPEDYEEWQYIATCGEPVLLELGSKQQSLIFADYEECFITVNVLAGIEDGLTKEDLQELADQIDFSILMNVRAPEMRGDSRFSD